MYNGFSRVGQSSPNELLGDTLGTALFTQASPPPAWNRLLTGSYGRDTGWLLPAALIAMAGIVVGRRGRPRTDPWHAGALLWGIWLVVLGVAFSVSTTMNSYYAGALSPAVAGLLGLGAALAWANRDRRSVLLVSAGTVLVTVGYAAWLLPSHGTGLPSALAAAVVVIGCAAVACSGGWPGADLVATPPPPRCHGGRVGRGSARAGAHRGRASVVVEGLGPFDTPFQPDVVTTFVHHAFGPQSSPPALATIESVRRGAPYLMAAQTSAVAAPYIYATGRRWCCLGGYTGTQPSPSPATLRAMVRQGRFHLALVASPGSSASAAFVVAHCVAVPPRPGQGTALAPKLEDLFLRPSRRIRSGHAPRSTRDR